MHTCLSRACSTTDWGECERLLTATYLSAEKDSTRRESKNRARACRRRALQPHGSGGPERYKQPVQQNSQLLELRKMPPKKKSGSSKSKEKKLKRKQEQAEIAAALAKVKAAYAVGDYMDGLQAFKKYNRNGLELDISFHTVSGMTKEDLQWAFDLMKECVMSLYINGGWGWSDRKKWDELTHDAACFVVARSDGRPMGFVNFRFDLDEGIEVVYCYEIHLCEEVRRKGLGKFLMQILELIGHRANMRKVLLTVFKENTISNDFFRKKLNYTDDESSPLVCDPYNEEEYTYSILSKHLIKKPAKPVAGAAKPVVRDECNCECAPNAHTMLEDGGRVTALHSSKTGLTGQSSTETNQPSSSQIQAQN